MNLITVVYRETDENGDYKSKLYHADCVEIAGDGSIAIHYDKFEKKDYTDLADLIAIQIWGNEPNGNRLI